MFVLKKVITLEWIEVERSFRNTRQRYCTAIIRQVLILPRWNFASTNQKHNLVLGTDTSSVWNLCTSFPEVISRSGGNRWWCHEMLVAIWGEKRYCFTISSPTKLFLTLYQGSTLAWRSTVQNKFTSFDRSSMRNSYFRRQGVLGLNLNYRPSIALSNLHPQVFEPAAKWRTHSTLLDVPG